MRWFQLDDLARVVLITRASLLPAFIVLPLLVLVGLAENRTSASLVPFGIVLAVQAVAVALVVDRHVLSRTPERWLQVTAVAAGLLAVVAALVVAGRADAALAGPLLATTTTLAVVPLSTRRWRTWLAAVVLASVAVPVLANSPTPVAAVPPLLFVNVAVGLSVRFSIWYVEVLRRLRGAEQDRAALAVAEERLRFARDLHDVVGRDLSAIAVTADLTAELARRGRPEAVERAEEVRRIAQDSLREVRAVVRGYRGVQLGAELDGSVALLRSAGVGAVVEGTAEEVPEELRSAVAWVVREGVTNIVRHAEANRASIRITTGPASVQVDLVNDGVRDATPRSFSGAGLAGLAERLHPLGGTLVHEVVDGEFRLRATVPMQEEAR